MKLGEEAECWVSSVVDDTALKFETEFGQGFGGGEKSKWVEWKEVHIIIRIIVRRYL